MAFSLKYYTVGGKIVGQRSSGSRIDFLTDALGSTIATCSSTGQLVNTYRYRPYGSQLAKSGSSPDPHLMWVGSLGYRLRSERTFSDYYVRNRHYGSRQAAWTSKDLRQSRLIMHFQQGSSRHRTPTMLRGLAYYGYVGANPVNRRDNRGLDVEIGPVPPGTTCRSASAVTGCNFSVGLPYTLICNSACDAPCTDAHEGQHRYDLKSCCQRASKCVPRFGLEACRNEFFAWMTQIEYWAECRGYRVGKLCREKEIKRRNCWNKKRGNCLDECCKHLIDRWGRDVRRIDFYCPGNDPFGPPPTPCPFDSSGGIL